ncbi:hypothetical protein [Ruegeria atlantica]|uniref:hypothetical protein n=1 Tax=Ruegeria atlantica TaxID=81569 RepID=UPI002494558D|nr:hypothetical protein [Ruegeria atlantica]
MGTALNTVEMAAETLKDADAVLIGAGAGMSAAAGLDYTDEVAFANRFPGMLQYGARNQYQMMGFPFKDEALKWGYLSVALDHVYRARQTKAYQDLLKLVGDKDYFVITSNVDRYFYKNGFDPTRIYTPQGDYELFQCLTPCADQTWDGVPLVDAMLPSVNRQTQKVEDKSSLAVCPNCGGPVFMNVRGGGWFIETPYFSQSKTFANWLQSVNGLRLAVIEIGAGFNTPSVIRWPMERIGTHFQNARFLRINRDYPEAPAGSLSLPTNADVALSDILAASS